MELAGKNELYVTPLHPYTQALLSAIPVANPDYKKERILLEGDVPSPLNPSPGCRFHTRCRQAMERCRGEEPNTIEVQKGLYVACHLVQA